MGKPKLVSNLYSWRMADQYWFFTSWVLEDVENDLAGVKKTYADFEVIEILGG